MALLLGYNPGLGTGHAHATPDLAGWQDAYRKIGPGSTGSNGAPFGQCVKLFDGAIGYPFFPTGWTGIAPTLCTNNGGVPLVPIFVWGSKVGTDTTSLIPPSAPTIAHFLSSMASSAAPGQTCAFQYVSEPESGSDINAGGYLNNWAIISTNLNTALASMGNPAFYNRGNFPLITASLMSTYAGGINTAYLPPPSQVDSYGADFYQHFTSTATENVGAKNDPRFQHWLASVKQVCAAAGVPIPSISLPEYGLGLGSYTAQFESQRAAILASDFNYLTGANAPAPLLFWMYWYQDVDKSANKFFCFPLADGTETWAQASLTITQWQSMLNTGPVTPAGPFTPLLPRPVVTLAGTSSAGALALFLPTPAVSLAGAATVSSVSGPLAVTLPAPATALSAQPPLFSWVQNLGYPGFANTATAVITLGAGVNTTVGNTVIVRAHSTAGNKVTGIADSRGNPYTAAQPPSSTAATAEIWSAPVSTRLVAGDKITVTWAAAKSQTTATADEFSGVATASPVDQGGDSGTVTGTSASVSAGPTTQPNELAVTAAGGSNTGTWTYPGGPWTALGTPGGTAPLQGAWQALTAVQTVTATWADAGAANMEAVIATFTIQPAGALNLIVPPPVVAVAGTNPHVDGTLGVVLPAPVTIITATLPPSSQGPFNPVLNTAVTSLAGQPTGPVSGTLGPLALPAPALVLQSGEPVEKLLILPQNQLQQIVWADSYRGNPVTGWLIVNRDVLNPIRVGYDGDHQVPDLLTPDVNVTSVIDPLGSLAVDAGQDWWAVSPYGDVMIDIIPNGTYWAPSPAQTAFQLQGLGLMRDSTGAGIAAGVGTPDGVTSVPLTEALSLGGTASVANAQQLLDANQGVTTELAALIASGNPSGSPGGVPLIIGATPLVQQAGSVNLGPGSVTTLGPFAVGQIAYEIYLELQETVAGTAGAAVAVSLSWVDSVTGLQLGLETYNIVPASPGSAQAHTVHGRGPSRGDQLTVTITNNDTVNVGALLNVLETSRVYSVALWQTFQSQVNLKFTGFTDTAFYPPSKVIADSLLTVNAGNTFTRILPLYTGQAKVLIVAGAASCSLAINTLDPVVSNLGQVYEVAGLAANSRTYTDIMFGNSQCTMALANTGNTQGSIGVEITAYPW